MHVMDGCTSGQNASLVELAAYQASLHRFGVGMDSVRPPKQRAVRGLLAFTRWPHTVASPSIGWWLMHVMGGRLHKRAERKLTLGELAAYQASLHRFGVGMDSVRPPE